MLWDVEHDRQLATLGDGGSGVKAITFTPDGRTLATGDAGGTITLWDLAKRKRVTTLPGQRGAIRDLAINAEGDRPTPSRSDPGEVTRSRPPAPIRASFSGTSTPTP